MSAPKRIQRQRTKGWRMPEGAIYVGRPTKWGNPFQVDDLGVKLAVGLYRNVIQGLWSPILLAGKTDEDYARVYTARENFLQRLGYRYHPLETLHELRGRDLACWCPLDQPCHADVLLEVANR